MILVPDRKNVSSLVRKLVAKASAFPKLSHMLTGSKAKLFQWTAKHQTVFQRLKKALLSSAPCPAYLTHTDEFILDNDASYSIIGVGLLHLQNGTERMIAYASHVLLPA